MMEKRASRRGASASRNSAEQGKKKRKQAEHVKHVIGIQEQTSESEDDRKAKKVLLA